MVWCVKCGSTSQEDTSLTFHRFPKPSVNCFLKTKVWAVYCFPDDDWTEYPSLLRLYRSHKMVCSKHFDDAAFTSNERKRLGKFAIPTEARVILAELRNQPKHRVEMNPADMDDGSDSEPPDPLDQMESVADQLVDDKLFDDQLFDDKLADDDDDAESSDSEELIQKSMESQKHRKIREYKSLIELKTKKIQRLQAQIRHYQRKLIELHEAPYATTKRVRYS